jgi:heme o synthase
LSRATLHAPTVAAVPPNWIARASIYMELSKARLSGLVVMTAAAGYAMAMDTPMLWGRFLGVMLGTTLAAFGANALNQAIERKQDALMRRTCHRPLPSGRLGLPEAVAWGLGCSVLGLLMLLAAGNALTAGLGAATSLLYLLAYTPLKRRTPANTLVGAVVGAIPPLMGAAAAAGRLSLGAYVLAAILFIWQIPHFLALAFLAREDYARGVFRMLPSLDPTGAVTGKIVLFYSVALLPAALAMTLTHQTGWMYACGTVILGLWLVALSVRMMWRCDVDNSRRLFLGSVIYLPLLLMLMAADHLVVMPYTLP